MLDTHVSVEMSVRSLQIRLKMRNIFKLIVVYVRLQEISYCYCWIHVVLVTKCIGNEALHVHQKFTAK